LNFAPPVKPPFKLKTGMHCTELPGYGFGLPSEGETITLAQNGYRQTPLLQPEHLPHRSLALRHKMRTSLSSRGVFLMRHISCLQSRFAILFALLLFFAFFLKGAPQRHRTPLGRQLAAIASHFGGKVTFAAVDLKTGERFGLAPDQTVATASVIKLPVMVEAFYQMQEGKVQWSQPVKETEFDRVRGSGILQDLNQQIGLTLGDAITLMIDLSDNTASNIVIQTVGINAVNARMQQLGLKHTKLFGYVFHEKDSTDPEARKFGLGETTADDMVHLLTLIKQHHILTPAACDHMLEILSKQRDIDAFPRYTSDIPGVTWEHKTGALEDIRNDVGIAETPAGPIVMASFAFDSPDHQWTADNAALLVLGRLAKATLDHFLPAQSAAKAAK
jgi:beta-lactamase class A